MRLPDEQTAYDNWVAIAETHYTDAGVEKVRRIAVQAVKDGTLSRRQAYYLIQKALNEGES